MNSHNKQISDNEFFSILRHRLGIKGNEAKALNIESETIFRTIGERVFYLHNEGLDFENIVDLFAKFDLLIDYNELKCIHCREVTRRNEKPKQFVKDSIKYLVVDSRANEFIEIENNLRNSIKTGSDFFLQYQPQINGKTNRIYGVEALIRWSQGGELINPNRFIPVAEATMQIGAIGEFVFVEACRKIREWRNIDLGGGAGFKINVNVSPIQLTRELVDMIFNTMMAFDVMPKDIGLELTESFLAGPESVAIVQALHDSGISIAIDDFGTGYSCLAEIKNFPIDIVKIDRAFISDINRSSKSIHIVKSIIDLAHNLGMSVIAEGVETNEQRVILEQMGCHKFQGFLFSKALSDVELVSYVKSRQDQPARSAVFRCE